MRVPHLPILGHGKRPLPNLLLNRYSWAVLNYRARKSGTSVRIGRLIAGLFLLTLVAAAQTPPPVQLTAEQDHQRMMDALQITSIRRGADGDPKSPYAANYDESKANPYPNLPDPLVLNNGKRVTTAKMWWTQRRPEIVAAFDREIYGRVPANTPKVRWEVISTTYETNGDVPVITKKLVGHVENSSYPLVTVDIQLTLTTPQTQPARFRS
jgi:hypothetical protein